MGGSWPKEAAKWNKKLCLWSKVWLRRTFLGYDPIQRRHSNLFCTRSICEWPEGKKQLPEHLDCLLFFPDAGRKARSRATYSLPMNDVSQCDWIISKGCRAQRRNGKWPL